ncbi:MAG: acetylxylan esterase [Limisphaerales bacterium]
MSFFSSVRADLKSTAALALFCASLCHGQIRQGPPPFVVSPDHTNGIYAVGETVHWRIEVAGANAVPQAHYILWKGELTRAAEGELTFAGKVATLDSKFESPGHLLLEVRSGGGQNGRALGGAIGGMDQIKVSAPRPDDFDAFWKAKLKELAAVPANPRLESAPSGRPNVAYWKITMDNIRGSHIYGQIARPSREGNFPAMLILQWAGVYPLQKPWVVDRAAEGWLALNIEPHDMPIDASDRSKAPDNYFGLGNDNRNTSYFLRMYLSCYRAAEYLRSRPDWDGKVLVAMGASQGGLQTLMIAGLHPGITAALALVPAGSDMLGPEIGRKGGWPQWFDQVWGKDPLKVHETSRYFDVANFAPHITCPVLVGFGLIDETCPPEGILATFNQIKSPKQAVVLPRSSHQEVNGSQRPFHHVSENFWLPALREGKPAPVGRE